MSSIATSKWLAFRQASLSRQRAIPVAQVRTFCLSTARWDEEPLRKKLKDERKRKQQEKRAVNGAEEKGVWTDGKKDTSNWQLNIGIEIHAQLNTERKLFSDARTSIEDEPNTNVALFDLALPGTQPYFQRATLIPALRAAIALKCQIQRQSKFDRKHYFYQDQPAGYQITQFYEPYAVNGHLLLTKADDINAPGHDDELRIGIKQIQIEQDTAKSTMQGTMALLDFNRAGHPLIEIITHPDLRSAKQAVAYVKKAQSILQAVNAVTTGMESGGLRADVNVSVAPKGSTTLGRRVEIKNLSTLQSIEAAITAEQERQIGVLESGGEVIGETRGWSLGSVETIRLRGKEGEVDYRYMPDPDIQPLLIGEDLIQHISSTLPLMPNDIIDDLVTKSGLTIKDAKTLVTLEDGRRLDYFDEVCDIWKTLRKEADDSNIEIAQCYDRIAANWILHEIGHLLSTTPTTPFTPDLVPAKSLAQILHAMHASIIARPTAKDVLAQVFANPSIHVEALIRHFAIVQVRDDEYERIAKELIGENPSMVRDIKVKGKLGKLQYLVGQIMRRGGKGFQPQKAEEILRRVLAVKDTK